MLDNALAQIPDAHRYGTQILVRADSTGSAKAFLTHIRTLREHGFVLAVRPHQVSSEPFGDEPFEPPPGEALVSQDHLPAPDQVMIALQ